MRRYDLISEICDAMLQLGWEPYQNDHEDANGQFEMNWAFADALETADRHAFFKYMVKTLAEKHGLRATFMPKPFDAIDRQRLPRAHLAVGSRARNEFVSRRGQRRRHFAAGLCISSADCCIRPTRCAP